MDLKTAVSVFQLLATDSQTETTPSGTWTTLTYDVRLDATTDSDSRACRVRVTPGRESGGIGEDEWRYVLDLAKQHELDVDIENSGMVLR